VPGQDQFHIDDYKASVRAACAEFLLNGVTCIADRLGDMDQIAPVIAETGIRAIVGQTLTDMNAVIAWKITDALLERFGTSGKGRVSAGIAPHALDPCGDALLRDCAQRAERTGARIFIHVAQSEPEVAVVRARGHTGALACLIATGLANEHTVAAHALYLSDK